MTQTINVTKPSEIRRIGTEALLKALGPIGMAKYLEEYDNGGTGDYTKEKYEQPDYSVEEIIAFRLKHLTTMRESLEGRQPEAAAQRQ